MAEIVIYTDGSANNLTHDKGGYGFVIINGSVKQYSGGSYYNTTSIRQEIRAVIQALKKCKEGDDVTVYSDNDHVVQAIDRKYLWQWRDNNFANRKNKDLWIQMIIQYKRLQGRIKMIHVRGHEGNHYNEVCDILAKRGGQKQKKINDSKIYTA